VDKDYETDCHELVKAGNDLYTRLFLPNAGHELNQAKRIFQWFENLAVNNPIEVLEIVILDEAPWSIPWNLVYENPYNKSLSPAQPEFWRPFWGYRYNLGSGRRVDPQRRQPLPSRPKVLVVSDSKLVTPEEHQELKKLSLFCDLTEVNNRSDLKREVSDH